MRFSTTVLPILAISGSALAHVRCADKAIPAHLDASSKYFRNQAATHALAMKEEFAARTQNVNVYFHVVAKDKTLAGGYIPESQLTDQLKALNDQYASTGISFTLKGSDFTVNAEWSAHSAIDDSTLPIEMAMKTALRKGSYKDLNVYFRPMDDGLLGICEFPTNAATPGSQDFLRDGCQVHAFSVPGGSLTKFNEGKTATHEIGHWLGLYHTFQGGCAGGDQVDDTPAEATSTSGCPKNKDTCTGAKYPGLDPIQNYMYVLTLSPSSLSYSYNNILILLSLGKIGTTLTTAA